MEAVQDTLQNTFTNGLNKLDDWAAPLIELLIRHGRMTEHQARVALGLVGAGTSLWLLWKLFGGKKYKLPPGPRPWPLVGNLREMQKDKRFYMVLDKLSKDYGPISTLYMGPYPAVVISSATLLREAWINDGLTYAMRVLDNATAILTDGGKDMLGAVHFDTRLQTQRKLAFAALRNYASGEALEDHVHHAFNQMSIEIEKSGGEIDALEMGYFISYNMLASMCFGTKFTFGDPFLKKIMDLQIQVNDSFSDPLLFLTLFGEFFKKLPLKVFTVIKDFRQTWMTYLGDNIDKHMKNYDPKNLSDFTDFIIHEMKQAENDTNERNKMKTLDEDNFRFILFDLFLAGTETTRLTLAWTWFYLAAFPEVQKKAQEEVERVLGRDGRVTTKSRENLPYVDAVLHEVMRIRPVAPLTIKQTTKDTTLAGYDIPKNTMVMSNAYSMHFDEKEWDDPHAFKPERWIDEDTGKYIYQQNGFMAFSVGRRSCIGESFAKLEIHMLVTLMIQNFTLKPQPGKQIDIEPQMTMDFQPKKQVIVAEKRA